MTTETQEAIEIIPLILDYRERKKTHKAAREAEITARQELEAAGDIVTAHLVKNATEAGQINKVITVNGKPALVRKIRGHWQDRSKVIPHVSYKLQDGAWSKRDSSVHDLGWDHINKRWRKLKEVGDGTHRFEEDGLPKVDLTGGSDL